MRNEVDQILADLPDHTNYDSLKKAIQTFKTTIRLLADEIDQLKKAEGSAPEPKTRRR